MPGAVIRDADDMEKFANALSDYEEAVKRLCDGLQGALGDAGQFMRDANSRAALMKISETLDEIKSELPDCAILTKKLTKSAGYVRDASNVLRR